MKLFYFLTLSHLQPIDSLMCVDLSIVITSIQVFIVSLSLTIATSLLCVLPTFILIPLPIILNPFSIMVILNIIGSIYLLAQISLVVSPTLRIESRKRMLLVTSILPAVPASFLATSPVHLCSQLDSFAFSNVESSLLAQSLHSFASLCSCQTYINSSLGFFLLNSVSYSQKSSLTIKYKVALTLAPSLHPIYSPHGTYGKIWINM